MERLRPPSVPVPPPPVLYDLWWVYRARGVTFTEIVCRLERPQDAERAADQRGRPVYNVDGLPVPAAYGEYRVTGPRGRVLKKFPAGPRLAVA